MWMAKAWNRQIRISQLASMARIAFWSLVIYFVFRLGDMVIRGQLVSALSGKAGILFAVEVVLGGIVPLLLLSRGSLRMQSGLLFLGAVFATLGVVFNRINVVLWAMDLRGPMPQTRPASYLPSVFEWGISIGLIAATIFLFGLGARLLPLLPKEEAGHI
jgi:formate dehydrogenase iron-sulfur subunit